MSTEAQTKYIEDLAVLKTKEFKEVKEMLVSNGIVHATSKTVGDARTLAAICDAITDKQASELIDVLLVAKTPARSKAYGTNRSNSIIAELEDIKNTIDDWGF